MATPAIRNLIRDGKTHQIYPAPQAGGRHGMQTIPRFVTATMINSGLSLLRALTILGEQTSNRRLGEVITQVRAEVEKGTSPSAALARHPGWGRPPAAAPARR